MTTLRSTLITAATCVAVAASFATARAQDTAPKPAAKPAEATKPAEAKPAEPAAASAPASETSDAALAQIDKFIAEQKIDKSNPKWRLKLAKPPRLTFTKGKTYLWDVETNHGKMTIELLPDAAPMHVSSTIYLTRLGYYDDLKFHRAIQGFMAQGGCPLGNGTGGPGYEYALEVDKKVKHDRKGRLSMANAGPNTDGSQFFLTYTATPFLDGGYSIFGQVKEGMNTLEEFEKRSARQGSGSEAPTEPLQLVRATIRVN